MSEFTKEEDRALHEALLAFEVGEAIKYDTYEALQYSDNPGVEALFEFDSLMCTTMDKGRAVASDLWLNRRTYPREAVREWREFVEETEAKISEHARILLARGQEANRNE